MLNIVEISRQGLENGIFAENGRLSKSSLKIKYTPTTLFRLTSKDRKSKWTMNSLW